MNIYRWIEWWANRTPGKTAIRFAGRKISYSEFATNIVKTASVLQKLGVCKGDRVGYLGLNSPEFLDLMFACARIGAILVPLNFRLAPVEHLNMLRNADAGLLFIDPRYRDSADLVAGQFGKCQLVSIADELIDGTSASLSQLMHKASASDDGELAHADSPVLIVYTSGTTGKPKGAVLTQNAVHWNGLNSQVMHDLRRTDHVLTTLPFFHVGGLNIQTTPALQAGATVTLIEKFVSGEFLTQVETDRPTLTVLVPTQMQAIAQHPGWRTADLSSLRSVTTGSTMVQVPLLEIWHEHEIPVVQVYGCTETGPIAIHQIAETAHEYSGSVGRRAAYCDVRVVDDKGEDVADGERGEIYISGPNILKEYWRNPEATKRSVRDGWFHTGDIGYRDRNGEFYVVDRKKRVIISGGENIYPSELEQILLEHPAITEAVVVGYPHEKWGEVPVAAIINSGGETPDPATLKQLFEGRVGHLKHPQHFLVLDAMPRNAMGKVVYAEVQSALGKLLEQ